MIYVLSDSTVDVGNEGMLYGVTGVDVDLLSEGQITVADEGEIYTDDGSININAESLGSGVDVANNAAVVEAAADLDILVEADQAVNIGNDSLLETVSGDMDIVATSNESDVTVASGGDIDAAGDLTVDLTAAGALGFAEDNTDGEITVGGDADIDLIASGDITAVESGLTADSVNIMADSEHGTIDVGEGAFIRAEGAAADGEDGEDGEDGAEAEEENVDVVMDLTASGNVTVASDGEITSENGNLDITAESEEANVSVGNDAYLEAGGDVDLDLTAGSGIDVTDGDGWIKAGGAVSMDLLASGDITAIGSGLMADSLSIGSLENPAYSQDGTVTIVDNANVKTSGEDGIFINAEAGSGIDIMDSATSANAQMVAEAGDIVVLADAENDVDVLNGGGEMVAESGNVDILAEADNVNIANNAESLIDGDSGVFVIAQAENQVTIAASGGEINSDNGEVDIFAESEDAGIDVANSADSVVSGEGVFLDLTAETDINVGSGAELEATAGSMTITATSDEGSIDVVDGGDITVAGSDDVENDGNLTVDLTADGTIGFAEGDSQVNVEGLADLDFTASGDITAIESGLVANSLEIDADTTSANPGGDITIADGGDITVDDSLDMTLVADGDIGFAEGLSKINAGGAATLDLEASGAITAIESGLTAESLLVTAYSDSGGDITVGDGYIRTDGEEGVSMLLENNEGNIVVSNLADSEITAEEGNIAVIAEAENDVDVLNGGGEMVAEAGMVDIDADSEEGVVNIANNDDSLIDGQTGVFINATAEGQITVADGAELNSESGTVTVVADSEGSGVDVANNANAVVTGEAVEMELMAENDINVGSGAELEATAGDMEILAETEDGSISVADGGDITVTGAEANGEGEAASGNLVVDLLADGAGNTVEFALGDSNVDVDGLADLDLVASGAVTAIESGLVASSLEVDAYSQDAAVTIASGAEVETTDGDMTVNAESKNGNVNVANDAVFTATAGTIGMTLTADEGDITVANAGELNADEIDMTLDADQGNISVAASGAELNADDVTLNMFAYSGMEVGSGSDIDIDGTFTIAGDGSVALTDADAETEYDLSDITNAGDQSIAFTTGGTLDDGTDISGWDASISTDETLTLSAADAAAGEITGDGSVTISDDATVAQVNAMDVNVTSDFTYSIADSVDNVFVEPEGETGSIETFDSTIFTGASEVNLTGSTLDISAAKTDGGERTTLDLSDTSITGDVGVQLADLSNGNKGDLEQTSISDPKSDQTVKLPDLADIDGNLAIENMTIASTPGASADSAEGWTTEGAEVGTAADDFLAFADFNTSIQDGDAISLTFNPDPSSSDAETIDLVVGTSNSLSFAEGDGTQYDSFADASEATSFIENLEIGTDTHPELYTGDGTAKNIDDELTANEYISYPRNEGLINTETSSKLIREGDPTTNDIVNFNADTDVTDATTLASMLTDTDGISVQADSDGWIDMTLDLGDVDEDGTEEGSIVLDNLIA